MRDTELEFGVLCLQGERFWPLSNPLDLWIKYLYAQGWLPSITQKAQELPPLIICAKEVGGSMKEYENKLLLRSNSAQGHFDCTQKCKGNHRCQDLIWIIYMPDLNLKDYIIFPPPEWRIDIQPCCKKTKFACCFFLQMLCRLPKFPGFCYLGGISMEMPLLIKAVQNDWAPPNLSFWETTGGRDNSSEDMRFFDFREDSRPRKVELTSETRYPQRTKVHTLLG